MSLDTVVAVLIIAPIAIVVFAVSIKLAWIALTSDDWM